MVGACKSDAFPTAGLELGVWTAVGVLGSRRRSSLFISSCLAAAGVRQPQDDAHMESMKTGMRWHSPFWAHAAQGMSFASVHPSVFGVAVLGASTSVGELRSEGSVLLPEAGLVELGAWTTVGACKSDAFLTIGLAKVGAWTAVGACKSDAFPTIGLAKVGAWTAVGACKCDASPTVGLVTIVAGAGVGAFTTVAVAGVGAFTTVASAGVGAGAIWIVVGALRSVLSFDVGLAKTGLVELVAAGVLCPEVGQAPTRGSLNEASLCDSHSAHLLHGMKLHLTSNAPVCSAHHELHPSFDSPDVGLVELRLELGAGADTPHDTGQFECM